MSSYRNIEREEILLKLYLSLTDVRNFMRCTWNKAHETVNRCNEMAKEENKINPSGKVYYKYLLKVTGVCESDIHRLAKVEREIQVQKKSPLISSKD